MQNRSGNEIREAFLRFFETKGHRRVHSSSLVPANDPTLLFTNAGMNQFKDLFLGAEKRDYSRATTSQKCVRAGGKHNDLENVGFTRRHHTFFEMLGNFSFGDYFKQDAIKFAWELVTSEEWFGIPKDRLYVTIFEGADGVPRDDEAEGYWIEAGRAEGAHPPVRVEGQLLADGRDRAVRAVLGDFLRHGDGGRGDAGCRQAVWTGRCAVCRDLEPGLHAVRSLGGCDAAGKTTSYKLTPLPKPSIDTGMGLERVAAVLQGKVSQLRDGSVYAADCEGGGADWN